jgi:PAS domain S-box-containing protein
MRVDPCACADEHPHDAIGTARGNGWLHDALVAGDTMVFEWDRRTGVSRRSANAGQILGFERANGMEATHFLACVHPDDEAELKSRVRRLCPDEPGYSVSFRFVGPDGRQIWLEETARAKFDDDGRVSRLIGVTRDVSASKRAEEHQRLLIAELNHRVKNVVARISAVAKATGHGGRTVREFVSVLDRRLQSLADAHTLLYRNRFQGIDLAELVRQQLAPYAVANNTTLSGPDVMLSPEAAEALALVLHELVTNAAKYGALSAQGGRVLVTWELCSSAACRVVWHEVGGFALSGPLRTGYGLTLIRELIGYELRGAVNFEFGHDGAHCVIDIPLEQLTVGRVPNR